jgi:hypothetical protein
MFILFSITVPSFFCRLFRLFGWMYKTKVEAGYEKKLLSCAFRQKKTEKQGQELCYSCGATQIDPAKAEPTQSKWCCRITVQPAVDAYWKFVRVALVSPFKTAAAALSPCRGSLGTGMPFLLLLLIGLPVGSKPTFCLNL